MRPVSMPSPAAAFTARFLARAPADVAASFTPAQLQAVRDAFGMRYAMDHAIDLRRRLRLPWVGGLYVVLLAGRDHRPEGRRSQGRRDRGPGGPGRRGNAPRPLWPLIAGACALLAVAALLALG